MNCCFYCVSLFCWLKQKPGQFSALSSENIPAPVSLRFLNMNKIGVLQNNRTKTDVGTGFLSMLIEIQYISTGYLAEFFTRLDALGPEYCKKKSGYYINAYRAIRFIAKY